MENKRLIYTKKQMLDLYFIPKSGPEELMLYPDLFNNPFEDNWCKKPLPSFDPVPVNAQTKYKVLSNTRNRTSSNHSGDGKDSEVDIKSRPHTSHSESKYKNFSRKGTNSKPESVSSDDQNFVPDKVKVVPNDFADNSGWKKSQSKGQNTFESSRPYGQDLYSDENHWKRWSKDTAPGGDSKSRPTNFNRFDRNTNWSRKPQDGFNRKPESYVRNKEGYNRNNDGYIRNQDVFNRNQDGYTRHNKYHDSSYSRQEDYPEDIWQDDYETEMKAEFLSHPEDQLMYYELPQPSKMPTTPVLHTDKNFLDESLLNLWYFKDNADNIQGPYDNGTMANRFATGDLNYATYVRRECDQRFLLLTEYRALYGRIPFTKGHTIHPILENTKIVSVDVNVLLVGVEHDLIPIIKAKSTICKTSSYSNNVQQQQPDPKMLELQEENRRLAQSTAELEKRLREKELENEKIQQDQEKCRLELKSIRANLSEEKISQIKEFPLETEEEPIENVSTVHTDPLPIVKEQQPEKKSPASPIDEEPVSSKQWARNGNKTNKPKPSLVADIPQVTETSPKALAPVEAKPVPVKKVEVVKPPTDTSSIRWNVATVPKFVAPKPEVPIRSLAEIQVEEEKEMLEMRKKQQLIMEKERAIEKAKSSRSFKDLLLNKSSMQSSQSSSANVQDISTKNLKDALLKSVNTVGLEVDQKNIWEIMDTSETKQPLTISNPNPGRNKSCNFPEASKPEDVMDDSLNAWCKSKLSRFANENRDIQIVIDLLVYSPEDNVLNLVIEMLEDSNYTRKFAEEFVKMKKINKEDDDWQTVTKTTGIPAPAVKVPAPVISKAAKKKKKMTKVDPSKFK